MVDLAPTTRRALHSLMWSFAQNWGNRTLTFVLFLILTRLLTPEEIGLAAVVTLILLVLGYLAEFGYGEALVQRQQLRPPDVTLPLVAALTLSVGLAASMVIFAPEIETQMTAPGLAPLLLPAALTLPIATISLFQEALYKRAFEYRSLALRMLTATALSGVIGIAAALAGLGALSLVLQALVLTSISAIWLWARPKWTPIRGYDLSSWKQLSSYSANVVSTRLLDFFTTRSIEFIILSMYGAGALGIYAVGSRVYQTFIQVLATTVVDVSLSTLSRIADDRARMATSYLTIISMSGTLGSPIFVGIAALSPELTKLLFGARWAESALVMQPLMLLGAVQAIQFVNGSYFSALGKPSYVASLNLVKFVAVVPTLLLVSAPSIGSMTNAFAAAQLVVTPLSFWLVVKLVRIDWRDIARCLVPVVGAAALAYLAVAFARPMIAEQNLPFLIELALLGLAFYMVYFATLALSSRRHFLVVLGTIRGNIMPPRPSG